MHLVGHLADTALPQHLPCQRCSTVTEARGARVFHDVVVSLASVVRLQVTHDKSLRSSGPAKILSHTKPPVQVILSGQAGTTSVAPYSIVRSNFRTPCKTDSFGPAVSRCLRCVCLSHRLAASAWNLLACVGEQPLMTERAA